MPNENTELKDDEEILKIEWQPGEGRVITGQNRCEVAAIVVREKNQTRIEIRLPFGEPFTPDESKDLAQKLVDTATQWQTG